MPPSSSARIARAGETDAPRPRGRPFILGPGQCVRDLVACGDQVSRISGVPWYSGILVPWYGTYLPTPNLDPPWDRVETVPGALIWQDRSRQFLEITKSLFILGICGLVTF